MMNSTTLGSSSATRIRWPRPTESGEFIVSLGPEDIREWQAAERRLLYQPTTCHSGLRIRPMYQVPTLRACPRGPLAFREPHVQAAVVDPHYMQGHRVQVIL